MKQIFQTQKRVNFREADPARIMFFANILDFSHDAFEDFVIKSGIGWKEYFQPSEMMIPLRHSEINFLSPLLPGETYLIEITVNKIGSSSFQMKYIFKQEKAIHAEVTTVHVCLDRSSKKKINIPEWLRKKLEIYAQDTESKE